LRRILSQNETCQDTLPTAEKRTSSLVLLIQRFDLDPKASEFLPNGVQLMRSNLARVSAAGKKGAEVRIRAQPKAKAASARNSQDSTNMSEAYLDKGVRLAIKIRCIKTSGTMQGDKGDSDGASLHMHVAAEEEA
jgi:hypothetical protein